MFVYQAAFSTLTLKEDKGSEYVIAWKSKGLFKTELYPLHYASLPNLKHLGYKIGTQLNTTPLVRDKNKYVTKFVKLTLSMI